MGYGWRPLPPPARDDGALIDARDRRQLVWNIEHFVSDDPTRRLDLRQTVNVTAKAGGYVQLHFKPAVYDHEIWFWLDRQLDRTTPRTAVQQLTATLAAAGLYAHQGWFTDVPDRVDWPEQPEAQWEYAARSGSRFPWSFGDDATLLGRYAWFNQNSLGQVQVVQQLQPDRLGLYDMYGNVGEWVQDWGEY